MNDIFTSYPLKPREMKDNTIDLVSTSLKTADASPIVLNKTDRILTKFEPVVVENDKEKFKCVSGKLIYEKKLKNDDKFPTEKLTRQSIKVGEFMEISLDTSETYNLYQGLKTLYDLYNNLGGTPLGSITYTKVDSGFKQLLAIIQEEPAAARLLGQKQNFELVKVLLQMITRTDSLESLKSSLKELGQTNMSTLTNAINIERIERVISLLESNMDNDNEESWQNIFAENQWILSQIFACPYTIYKEKAYVGGKCLANTGGNICDFVYQNDLTQNIALIEIKTPCTSIFGNKYRGTYSLSTDMSGAINQVLNYKDNIAKEYYTNCYNSSRPYKVSNPKCFVIIGKMSSLESLQRDVLENYRNSLNNIAIITFDELLNRIKDTLDVFITGEDLCPVENTELPF